MQSMSGLGGVTQFAVNPRRNAEGILKVFFIKLIY